MDQANKKKCLFLLKKKQGYGEYAEGKTGLSNSVRGLVETIENEFHAETKVAICIDANSIDKEVYDYKPDYCFIEAIWVTPEKMKEIAGLHKKVTFIVRVHSRIPFLSNEGNALQTLKGYEHINNVMVSFNNYETSIEARAVGMANIYLPNVYKVEYNCNPIKWFCNKLRTDIHLHDVVNIGCFGAIRPMKNQLLQAVAAIIYGNVNKKTVLFHINAGRTEQNGNNVLKNLRALFEGTKHELVEHDWMEYGDFIDVVKKMDIGMQVSLSESFNIVTADFVINDVPIIVSEDITWMPDILKCSDSNAFEIADMIEKVIDKKRTYADEAKRKLAKYNDKAIEQWSKLFN